MDILLVNARLKEITDHARHSLPLGLAYLGSVFRESGFSVSVVDLNVTPMASSQLEQIITVTNPAILGISTNTATYLNGLDVAALAKRVNPQIKVVMGGPHASILYDEVARQKDVDVVVIGEGEVTGLELANYFIRRQGTLADIAGIAVRFDGFVKVTGKRPPVLDPDALPFPARDLFPLGLYHWPFEILGSRGGCAFACRFCAVNNIWGGKRYFRKPEKILAELQSIVPKKDAPSKLSFADDSFSLNKKQAMGLCRALRESRSSEKWLWKCSTRVDLIDSQLLKEMYLGGCRSIMYGIEAGSQAVLDSIGKKITIDQIKRAVNLTLESGIGVHCSFMFPLPEDTEHSIREQIAFMKELSRMGANESIALTTPYPGTYFYDNADSLGIQILSQDWNEYDCRHHLIATKNLSREKIESLWLEMTESIGGYEVPAQAY